MAGETAIVCETVVVERERSCPLCRRWSDMRWCLGMTRLSCDTGTDDGVRGVGALPAGHGQNYEVLTAINQPASISPGYLPTLYYAHKADTSILYLPKGTYRRYLKVVSLGDPSPPFFAEVLLECPAVFQGSSRVLRGLRSVQTHTCTARGNFDVAPAPPCSVD